MSQPVVDRGHFGDIATTGCEMVPYGFPRTASHPPGGIWPDNSMRRESQFRTRDDSLGTAPYEWPPVRKSCWSVCVAFSRPRAVASRAMRKSRRPTSPSPQ